MCKVEHQLFWSWRITFDNVMWCVRGGVEEGELSSWTSYEIRKVDACHPVKPTCYFEWWQWWVNIFKICLDYYYYSLPTTIYLCNLVFCSLEGPGWHHQGRSLIFRIGSRNISKAVTVTRQKCCITWGRLINASIVHARVTLGSSYCTGDIYGM